MFALRACTRVGKHSLHTSRALHASAPSRAVEPPRRHLLQGGRLAPRAQQQYIEPVWYAQDEQHKSKPHFVRRTALPLLLGILIGFYAQSRLGRKKPAGEPDAPERTPEEFMTYLSTLTLGEMYAILDAQPNGPETLQDYMLQERASSMAEASSINSTMDLLLLLVTASGSGVGRVVRDDGILQQAALEYDDGTPVRPDDATLIRVLDSAGYTVFIIVGINVDPSADRSDPEGDPVMGLDLEGWVIDLGMRIFDADEQTLPPPPPPQRHYAPTAFIWASTGDVLFGPVRDGDDMVLGRLEHSREERLLHGYPVNVLRTVRQVECGMVLPEVEEEEEEEEGIETGP